MALIPDDFSRYLTVANAEARFAEAVELGGRLEAVGIQLTATPDHAAIFCDPPALVAGPLKQVGYVNGRDCRCYPSPVDGQDYINVAASLPQDHPARSRGWWDHVAVVHPVDDAARAQMLSQGYGNPFVHHLTFGLVPPALPDTEYGRAAVLVRAMTAHREQIGQLFGCRPGDLVIALPEAVVTRSGFPADFHQWVGGLDREFWQVEPMQGGGFLLQFFVLQGGRIEVAMRVDTTQVFNPRSVHKISAEEISTVQG
ncbi:MAG: hypothetical protein FJX77_14475 [Armatimonadetes bacterium]|nr:hypothetical protein [Armatimonadota bacterium]